MASEPHILSFTLDTNCIIDVAEADSRPAAAYVQKLLLASSRGEADLALVASSASERQSSGLFLQSFDVFNERRTALGFGNLQILPSIARWGVSFFDNSLRAGDDGIALEWAIYRTLFPTSPFEWRDFAAFKGADAEDTTSSAYLRWRNQMLDAQALWAHHNANRDVFVTSDAELAKVVRHPDLAAMVVKTPQEAALLLSA